MISFEGQVAVVTGAGGGLGRVYAEELGRRGARVVVNDLGSSPDGSGHSASPAADVVTGIEAAGGRAILSTDSVTNPEGGDAIVAAAMDTFGRLDIVINNAGILRDRSLVNLEPADLDAVLDVHLKGAFNVSRPALRQMKRQGYGRFLFTTSAAGLFGNFGQSNYAAAKMGLVGLSGVLAIEGMRNNITSNVIAPLARSRLTTDVLGPLYDALDPAHVAALALYLVSSDADITHEVYSAGGGHYARVFIGLTSGWSRSEPGIASVEDVGDHMREIRDATEYSTPLDLTPELDLLRSLHRVDSVH